MATVLIHLPFPEAYLNRLKNKYPQLDFVVRPEADKALEAAKEVEIMIVFFFCSKALLDAAVNLKWVQAISAGVEHIDLETLAKRKIPLTSGRGIHKIYMAEFAIAAMINLACGLPAMFRNQMTKKWDRRVPRGEINGAVAGILGLGAIGRETAKKASLMGMRVIGVKRKVQPVEYVDEVYGPEEMAELFKKSDYIINLLPGTRDTHKLIDKNYFDLMKKSACFINIGRGRTVNEPDLIEALKNGTIRAMVSDVFYTEPLPKESPLWDLENVILTPHVSGVSPKYLERAMEIINHNLNVYVSGQGEMINQVDLALGY